MTDDEIDSIWLSAKQLLNCGNQYEALMLYKQLASAGVFGSHVAAASLLEELGQGNWAVEVYSLLRKGVKTSDHEALLMIGRLAMNKCEACSAISVVRAKQTLNAIAVHASSNTTRHIAAYLLGLNEAENESGPDWDAAKFYFQISAENGSIPALYWLARTNAMQNNRFRALVAGLRWATLSLLANCRPNMRNRLMIK